jgi:hypothetical protein
MATADAENFLKEWHRIVAERDLVALPSVLHPDVVMGSPPYWQRFDGREVVGHLLGIILCTIEGFRYHREWCKGDELALEFTGHVDDIELQGIDLMTLDGGNRLSKLDVLIRPMNAIERLQEVVGPQMAEFFKDRAG